MVQTTIAARQLADSPTEGKVAAVAAGDTDIEWIEQSSLVITPAGSDTQVQFNNGGIFGASGDFTWDDTTLVATNLDAMFTLNVGTLATINEDGAGGQSFRVETQSDPTSLTITEAIGLVINEDGVAAFDTRIESDNNVNMFFLDAGLDMIGIGTAAPAYELDVIGDLASESEIVNSSTANSDGGLQRTFSEATSGALVGPTGTIQANIPTGSRIIGVQLRVDTVITGPTTWNADYSGGSAQVILTLGTLSKNDKFNVMYDTNAASDIASSEVDITLTAVGGLFVSGVVRAIVYFEQMIAMGNNP